MATDPRFVIDPTLIIEPRFLQPGTVYIVRDNNWGNPENHQHRKKDGQLAFHQNGLPLIMTPGNKVVSLDYIGLFHSPEDRAGKQNSIFHFGHTFIRFPNDTFTFYRHPNSNALNTPRDLDQELNSEAIGGKQTKKRKKRNRSKKSKQYR